MFSMLTIDCKLTARHCGPEYCHCMIPSSFLKPTATSFMAFSNWWLPSGVPTWHTLNFIHPHRKESNGIKLGDWLGQIFGPTLLIHIPLKFSFTSSVTSQVKCWGFSIMLQPHSSARTSPINSSLFTIQKKSCNRVVLKHPLIKCGPITLWPNIPHHMLTENLCSTIQLCATACELSCTQEC